MEEKVSPAEMAAADGEEGVPSHIALRVVAQSGMDIHFKIRATTPLRKLIDTYCSRQSLQPGAVRFLYDGERIHGAQTPAELDMQDGDVIDAVLMQTGGADGTNHH